jgi:hypothetical protein
MPAGLRARSRRREKQVRRLASKPIFEAGLRDLGLDRDVEGRDRLVADYEARLEDERAGDPDPLTLAARGLVARGREMCSRGTGPSPRARAERRGDAS